MCSRLVQPIRAQIYVTFSTRRCSTVLAASTSAQIRLHSSRNALIGVEGNVSSTKQYFLYLYPNAFNSASDPTLLLLAVLVESPLSLAVFLWVSAQSHAQSSP